MHGLTFPISHWEVWGQKSQFSKAPQVQADQDQDQGKGRHQFPPGRSHYPPRNSVTRPVFLKSESQWDLKEAQEARRYGNYREDPTTWCWARKDYHSDMEAGRN